MVGLTPVHLRIQVYSIGCLMIIRDVTPTNMNMSAMNDAQTIVSVIMPALNAERHIERGVASVLNQSLREIELIVVDNGSTDGTADILGSFHDPRLKVIHESVRGVSRARNTGLSHASGRYVAFLDADDTWAPDCLEKLYSALAQHPDAILAYCGWQNIGLPGDRGKPFIPPDYEGIDKMDRLLYNNRWPIHAALARYQDILDAGGFDQCLAIAEDYLLWLELAVRGRLLRVPEVLAFYHHYEGTRATNDRNMRIIQILQAKFIFLSRHAEVAQSLGAERLNALTWGVLIEQVNNMRQHERAARSNSRISNLLHPLTNWLARIRRD